MLITTNDIQTIRDISANVSPDRIEPYIMQVEQLLVIPALGAELYQQLVTFRNTDNAQNDHFHTLLYGGYYNTGKLGRDYEMHHFMGLIQAIAYLTYSKAILNQQINFTAYGLRVKQGEFSTEVNEKAVTRASNEAREIGLEYLNQCVQYCQAVGLIDKPRPIKKKRKFRVF